MRAGGQRGAIAGIVPGLTSWRHAPSAGGACTHWTKARDSSLVAARSDSAARYSRPVAKRFAVVTQSNDLHGRAVAAELRQRGIECSVVAADQLSGSRAITWTTDATSSVTLPSLDGPLDIRGLDAIWWRRGNLPTMVAAPDLNPERADFVQNECRSAVRGVLRTEFTGAWVSNPDSTEMADDKIVQLRAAQAVGLTVPTTLVSNDPREIREFCEQLDYRVVVKALRGSRLVGPTLTHQVNERAILSDRALSIAPAIFQELVPGRRHIRANVFGDDVYAAIIESDYLDWRVDHNVPMFASDIASSLGEQLQAVLRTLNLRMGVFDLKLDDDDRPIWLELNPQGQFLFLEGIADMPLTQRFADFLIEEAATTAVSR